jgi:P27 family predicted phage terminase small subunit
MPAGRPRKPRALKLVMGTDRPSRANQKAPVGASVAVGAPPGDLNDFAQLAWRSLAELVDPLKVVTRADLVAFRQMAVVLGVIEQAREALDDAGELTFVVSTETGEVIRKRPEVEILATYQRILDAKLARFGLTPAEREKVSAADEGAAADPLDEFAAS